MALIESDDGLRSLLAHTRSIAVLGAKAGTRDDAFEVPLYMQAAGYRILPVNPKLETVFGERVAPDLAHLHEPYELLDVFRAPQHLPSHVDEILALSTPPAAVWFQLGIRHDACAERLVSAGLDVVQDRCLMVEHRRLLAAA